MGHSVTMQQPPNPQPAYKMPVDKGYNIRINRWLCLILCLLCATATVRGQTPAPLAPQPTPQAVESGVDDFGPSRAELSPAQERTLWQDIQRNLATLRDAGKLPSSNSPQAVTYAFPLRLTPGLPDAAGLRVSAFAYHNPSGAQVVDYNGGTRTVAGHRGTDYALWPFSWNKLDAGDVQVVAAAAGTVVGSFNVDPTDHNCNSPSSDPWNYVALLHADGRLTIYGHLRYNSLTSKGVGASVGSSTSRM